MPYSMFKRNGKFCVRNSETGENKGCSTTLEKARAHMRRLYMVENEKKGLEASEEVEMAIDALIDKAVEDMVDEDAETENEEKEAKGKYSDMYIPMSVTSYNDLRAMVENAERFREINDLVYTFPQLASNILYDTEITDKSAAISALADELSSLIDEKANEEKELFEINEEKAIPRRSKIIDLVINTVKEAFGISPKEPDEESLLIWKEGGKWRWFARYSNNFRDRDNPPEIISADSHKKFVEMVDKGLAPYPELWLWHVPDWKIGQATWVTYDDSGFALAAGYFNKGCEQVAEWLSHNKQLAVSHGMPPNSIVREEGDPTVIVEHQTVEISPLPSWAAANVLTDFITLTKEDAMAIPSDKRKALIDKWGMSEEVVNQIEALNAGTAEDATAKGIESKEKDVETSEEVKTEAGAEGAETPAAEMEETAPAEETASDEAETTSAADTDDAQKKALKEPPTREEVADVIAKYILPVANENASQIKELSETVQKLSETVEKLALSDEEKMKEMVNITPLASLLMGSVIGNDDAQIDKRSSLARQKPKEKEVKEDPLVPIPFINSMLQAPASEQ